MDKAVLTGLVFEGTATERQLLAAYQRGIITEAEYREATYNRRLDEDVARTTLALAVPYPE